MRLHESPPENERTRSDRLADAPPLFWAMLGVVAVLLFIGALVLFAHHRP